MNTSMSWLDQAEHYEYRGYTMLADATQNGGDQWLPQVQVMRDGQPVELDASESVSPYWATRAEAIRAGIEHARLWLDKRDGILNLRNPARGPASESY